MFKRITLVLLSINLLASSSAVADNASRQDPSFIEYVVFWAVVISGTTVTVVYAPIVIPVALAHAKAAAVIAGTKAVAAGTAIKTGCIVVGTKTVAAGTVVGSTIKTGIAIAAPVAKTLGPVVLTAERAIKIANNAPEVQLHMVTTVEYSKFSRSKEDFEKCMNKYASSNRSIVPETCRKEELLFALLAQANIQQK